MSDNCECGEYGEDINVLASYGLSDANIERLAIAAIEAAERWEKQHGK